MLTGAGKGFCAGADMDMLQGIGEAGGVGGASAPVKHYPPYYATTLNKPVIAAINGACAGIGLVHAMMCDIRFAASGAKFTTAFARRGLIAEHGVSWVLPRLIGPAKAMDVLLSGRVFLAEEAEDLGMVNKVFAPEALVDETVAYAQDLAANFIAVVDGRDEAPGLEGAHAVDLRGDERGRRPHAPVAPRGRLQGRRRQLRREAPARVQPRAGLGQGANPGRRRRACCRLA